MKKLLLIAALALLSSCATNEFSQIYKTKPVAATSNGNVYENADCRISYDFWGQGGDAGFTIYNKTSEPLTVHVDKSFYIVNGNAYDYFQARTFTTAKSQTKTTYASTYLYRLNMASAGAISSGYSTAYEERPEIVIPAKSAKSFREYKINLLYFAHCDLPKFPSKRNVKSVRFGASDSPFVFSNSITYSVGGKATTAVHDFYVVNEAKENFYIEYWNK